MRPILFLSGGAHRALNPSADAPSGGAELQVALLAKALAARGRPSVVLAGGPDVVDGSAWGGVRVRDGGRFDTGGLRDAAAALPRVWSVLREERPSHVVVYGWTSWLAVLAVLRAVLGFRLVFVCALDSEVDGTFERGNPVRGRLLAWGMRAADRRFGITEAHVAQFCRRGMPAALTRLLVAPFEHATGAKSLDMLWVARCHPDKQPMRFIELAAKFPAARCRMICTPQDRGLFERTRAQAAVLPQIEFLDGVPYVEIQRHFNAARVFVNTSRAEGVPNTFLHAAMGGAAIASLAADPDGLIGHFGAGVSAHGDFAVLEAGARRLIEEPAALDAAVRGARRFLGEWHDNARNVEAFLEGLGP